MPIVLTVAAPVLVCTAAFLLACLVSPGRPERNTIGYALRDRSRGQR